MKRQLHKALRATAAGILAVGAATATVAATSSPASAAETQPGVTSQASSISPLSALMDAGCFSTEHLVRLAIVGNGSSPYPRAVRVLYRNSAAASFTPLTGWTQAGTAPIESDTMSWNVPASKVGWHQYAVETAILTGQGWQSLGPVLANATQGTIWGFGNVYPSKYPGWCYA